MRELQRGEVVLAEDPYNDRGWRPFVIVSDESYPFYPNGYLGIPMTRKDKPNTFELHEYDIEEVYEPFEKDDNFVNPYSPVQINNYNRSICIIGETFMDMVCGQVAKSLGLLGKRNA